MLLKLPTAYLNDPGGRTSSCICSSCHIHEPGSNVAEIVESSRIKAQRMVDAAMQVSENHSIFFLARCMPMPCECLQTSSSGQTGITSGLTSAAQVD